MSHDTGLRPQRMRIAPACSFGVCPLTNQVSLNRLSKVFACSLMTVVLSSALAKADVLTPPAPPIVDAAPPPPVYATIDPEEALRPVKIVHDVRRVVYEQPQPVVPAGDPYGFTNWLNGVRGQYGLGAVGHDPSLSGWAAANNDQQNARGMGHHVMGPARRQNSGMGGMETVAQMWMASPAHQAALLDPSITWIGIAGAGAYWTFNAY